MLDPGSVACSIRESAVEKPSSAGVLPVKQHPKENIIFGCGDSQTLHDGFYDRDAALWHFLHRTSCGVFGGSSCDASLENRNRKILYSSPSGGNSN